jgi:hypothetical protein
MEEGHHMSSEFIEGAFGGSFLREELVYEGFVIKFGGAYSLFFTAYGHFEIRSIYKRFSMQM